jgi:hypothetical protein
MEKLRLKEEREHIPLGSKGAHRKKPFRKLNHNAEPWGVSRTPKQVHMGRAF